MSTEANASKVDAEQIEKAKAWSGASKLAEVIVRVIR